MQLPLEISYRNVNKTEALESLIHEKTEKLEQVCDYMTSCRVAVEEIQKHQRSGNPFRVRVDITVPPGHEIVAKKEPGEEEMHKQLPTVIRDTFDAARRQLQELVERQREEVKSHPEQQVEAVVGKLFRKHGYGFIRTIDGREVYFHKNSVLNDDFERLEVGTGVRFEETEGEKGPQATTVQIIDKPGSTVSDNE